MNIGTVNAIEKRTDGTGPGGDKKLVIGFPPFFTACQLPDKNTVAPAVDGNDLMVDAGLYVIFFIKCFWSSGDERLFFVYQTGNIVRNASG